MNPTFEDRLLKNLMDEVESRAEEKGFAPSPVRRVVTVRRASVALAACGVAAAAAVVLPGTGASPAYAVEKHADGSVTLTVEDAVLSGPEQRDLVRKLTEAGIHTQVNQVPKGMRCAEPTAQLLGSVAGVGGSDVPPSAGTKGREDGGGATALADEKARKEGSAVHLKCDKVLYRGDTVRIDNTPADDDFPGGFSYFFYRGGIGSCELEPVT